MVDITSMQLARLSRFQVKELLTEAPGSLNASMLGLEKSSCPFLRLLAQSLAPQLLATVVLVIYRLICV